MANSGGEVVRRFASDLQALQASAGSPSFRDLERLAKLRGDTLPRSTAAEAVAGKRLPSIRTTMAFVDACIAHAETLSLLLSEDVRDIGRWQQRVIAARRLVRQSPPETIAATSNPAPIATPSGGASQSSNGRPTSTNVVMPDRALGSSGLLDRAKSWAVLMGTAHYTSDDLPDLPAVAANVRALRGLLTHSEHGSFDARQCTTLTDVSDLATVGRAVQEASASADDVLLFYYSGHAFLDPHGELYLSLSGSEFNSPYFTAVSFERLARELEISRAEHTVIVLDCDFAGLAFQRGPIGHSSYVLCATSPTRRALAVPGEEFTAFTGALLVALGGSTAGKELPDTLSLDWIYTELVRQAEAAGRPTPQRLSTGTAGHLALTWSRTDR
ncbi:caspase domain-containing protein [Streptomyces sp. NPDC101149]|uniref:caspase family protein n=1 Tax=Streptomyces sp. NPDC101149 TaxID=3366113 RepID=UPI00380354FE